MPDFFLGYEGSQLRQESGSKCIEFKDMPLRFNLACSAGAVVYSSGKFDVAVPLVDSSLDVASKFIDL